MTQTLHRGLVVFLISCSTQVFGLDLTRLDMSFQYDLRLDTHVEYRIIDSGEDQYTVIYNVSNDTTGLWLFNILLQNTYKSEVHDTLSLASQDIIYQDNKQIFYAIDVPKSAYDLLIFSFNNLSEGIYRLYDAPLNNPGGYPSFYPTDGMVLRCYPNITLEMKFLLVDWMGQSTFLGTKRNLGQLIHRWERCQLWHLHFPSTHPILLMEFSQICWTFIFIYFRKILLTTRG